MFWLDGEFWGDPETEYTAPFEPEEDADVHACLDDQSGFTTGGIAHDEHPVGESPRLFDL